MALAAFASGCSSVELNDAERAFFREARPCGLILFQRNCSNPGQLRRLVGQAAEAVGGSSFMVLIDQEGGRVRRLRPPEWRNFPAARAYAGLYAKDRETGLEAARLSARLIADDLKACGINLNAAPVLDLPVEGAHDIIGDRAYGSDPQNVIALARAVAEGYLQGGVIPVIKHIPGHGRARADSHESLPVIDAGRKELRESDFVPFMALKDLPAAMTAHVVMTAFDPKRAASVSPTIIGEVIRGLIGFDGFLMSDDLNMKALEGTLAEKACAVLDAGCDIALHCSGILKEMHEVAEVVPELTARRLERFEAAVALTRRNDPYDRERAEALLERAAQEAG